jgi:predicted Zn-dependent protease with MMP-like domain
MDDDQDAIFEGWVIEAIDALPAVFRERLGSVAITIEAWPTKAQLDATGAPGLFGIYQGIPRSAIGAEYAAVPSRITIFRGPIEQWYHDEDARRAGIDTVHHEIAHHFGISTRAARARDRPFRRPGARHLSCHTRVDVRSCSSRTILDPRGDRPGLRGEPP